MVSLPSTYTVSMDRLFTLGCILFISFSLAQNTTFDPLTFVDPLIGSTNGGNVFAGASLPYGLAKAVANVDGQNTGGFATDGSNVTGFSCTYSQNVVM